jgi:DNA primase
MPIFSKESLETLRQRVDLVDVLSGHMDLKKSGASYKGLCPFHDEKTPSFTIQKGDTHYHCFGCGAHGDSIHFLMSHLKMGFLDAVESLAQRFGVPLQKVESTEENKGPNKAALKEALDSASHFYQYILLHTAEGHQALHYLFERGIDLDFVRRFRIGLAPRESGMVRKVLHAKHVSDAIQEEAGLIAQGREGGWRDFFQDRITFPICDATGAVIGFSARKYKEDTFGGKYINTSETPLFKKSKVLFGLHHCRRRIAKERKAIIVEGQIDALRLITSGFNITVAGQGTAFGESHAAELIALGLNEVYLALDSDEAGRQAAYKIGDFFQKEGIETKVIVMPQGEDPDSFIREKGPEAFLELMENAVDYLSFTFKLFSQKINAESPAGKNELAQMLSKQVRNWRHPLMIHESLRKLAHLLKVPETMLGVGQDYVPNLYIKKSGQAGLQTIDPNRILESDFLRWLLLAGHSFPQFMSLAQVNMTAADLRLIGCRKLYEAYCNRYEEKKACDLLILLTDVEGEEAQLLVHEIHQKKINLERAEEHFRETLQKLLDRNWMELREGIRTKIQSAQCSEEEVLELVRQFDELKRNPPKIKHL